MDNKIKSLKHFRVARVVHVAGTNGKGSTCAYIAGGLIQSGYKVGKFTSPHVLDITERVTVDDIPVNRGELDRLCEAAASCDCSENPSRFEVLMYAALRYFEEKQVDYAVIETGIGGLLDCTNRAVVNPAVSVITKIGFDHTELLGNTIEEIAAHKAGIINPGVPVVTDPTQVDGALKVIRETAEKLKSPLFIPDIAGASDMKAGMRGGFQLCNAITASEALRVLGVEGCDFSTIHLPARMQLMSERPFVIVDGAHNPDAIRAVAEEVEKIAAEAEYNDMVIILGTRKSKDRDGCVRELERLNYRRLIFVEDVFCKDEIALAFKEASAIVNENGLILICGSLYLAGEVLKLR